MTEAINVSKARENLYKLIDKIALEHKPVLIKSKRNNAIIISEEDFNAIEETLYLLSIPKMRESIIEGINTPAEECEKTLDWDNV